MTHVNYPHHPGYLYDCPACEEGPCQCADKPGWAPCVSEHCERQEEDFLAVDPSGYYGFDEPRL